MKIEQERETICERERYLYLWCGKRKWSKEVEEGGVKKITFQSSPIYFTIVVLLLLLLVLLLLLLLQ